jgi:hypothetical protein
VSTSGLCTMEGRGCKVDDIPDPTLIAASTLLALISQ